MRSPILQQPSFHLRSSRPTLGRRLCSAIPGPTASGHERFRRRPVYTPDQLLRAPSDNVRHGAGGRLRPRSLAGVPMPPGAPEHAFGNASTCGQMQLSHGSRRQPKLAVSPAHPWPIQPLPRIGQSQLKRRIAYANVVVVRSTTKHSSALSLLRFRPGYPGAILQLAAARRSQPDRSAAIAALRCPLIVRLRVNTRTVQPIQRRDGQARR